MSKRGKYLEEIDGRVQKFYELNNQTRGKRSLEKIKKKEALQLLG